MTECDLIKVEINGISCDAYTSDEFNILGEIFFERNMIKITTDSEKSSFKLDFSSDSIKFDKK